MVERPLCMREVQGSNPCSSTTMFLFAIFKLKQEGAGAQGRHVLGHCRGEKILCPVFLGGHAAVCRCLFEAKSVGTYAQRCTTTCRNRAFFLRYFLLTPHCLSRPSFFEAYIPCGTCPMSPQAPLARGPQPPEGSSRCRRTGV